MSSLSSGLNSACSVVTTDFIDRFRKREEAENRHVRLAKYVSLVIGVVVVALGTLVGQIEGNLLELCFKIANLLVTPLFLLFFMAMFIPWATSFGTYVGAACGVLVAVAIAYHEELGLAFIDELGLTFVWMLPASFVAGAFAGTVASLLPLGRRREPDTG